MKKEFRKIYHEDILQGVKDSYDVLELIEMLDLDTEDIVNKYKIEILENDDITSPIIEKFGKIGVEEV